MRVLVLDTIHGGRVLSDYLVRNGDSHLLVDVYRGPVLCASDLETVKFDVVTAPVHLDPDYPLLHLGVPVVSHHEMSARLAEKYRIPCIEITGAEGKTTTAFAVASLLSGSGILHTSAGTFLCPEMKLLFRRSITPASLLCVLDIAEKQGAEWIVCEESLGVSGIGELGILTSLKDYRIASGKKSALTAKLESLQRCKKVLYPDRVNSLVSVDGIRITSPAGSFENPLVQLPVYRNALKTAAAAAFLLGLSVSPLGEFAAVPGRMHLYSEEGVTILDNANSGTNAENTASASAYLRKVTGKPVVLVIGEESQMVCEGFSNMESVIDDSFSSVIFAAGKSLPELKKEGIVRAKEQNAALLLAVKMWR